MIKANRGKYFEEFVQGEEYLTDSRVITENDITDFAKISGDYNKIHTNAEYAKESLYGERIAHGLLGLTVISGLASKLGFTEGTIISLREINWKFRKPVKILDEIEGSFVVDRKRDLAGIDGGMINFKVEVTNQKKEIVQSGKWAMIIKNKPID